MLSASEAVALKIVRSTLVVSAKNKVCSKYAIISKAEVPTHTNRLSYFHFFLSLHEKFGNIAVPMSGIKNDKTTLAGEK